MQALVGGRPELEYLRLKGCDGLKKAALMAIATRLPHLRVLDLTGAGLGCSNLTCPIRLLQVSRGEVMEE